MNTYKETQSNVHDVYVTTDDHGGLLGDCDHTEHYEINLYGDVDARNIAPNCTHLAIYPSTAFYWTAPAKCVDIKCTMEMYSKLTNAAKFHWSYIGIIESPHNESSRSESSRSESSHFVVRGVIKQFRVEFMKFVYDDFDVMSMDQPPEPLMGAITVRPLYFDQPELTEYQQFLGILQDQPFLQEIKYERELSGDIAVTKTFCKLRVDPQYVFMCNFDDAPDHFVIFERAHIDKFDESSFTMVNGHMWAHNMKFCIGKILQHVIPFAIHTFKKT